MIRGHCTGQGPRSPARPCQTQAGGHSAALHKDNPTGCLSLPLLAVCLLSAGPWEHCGKIDRCSYCPLPWVMCVDSGCEAKRPSQAVSSQLGLPFPARSARWETRRGQEDPGSWRGEDSGTCSVAPCGLELTILFCFSPLDVGITVQRH